jgi:hypothetical protein
MQGCAHEGLENQKLERAGQQVGRSVGESHQFLRGLYPDAGRLVNPPQ